MIQNIKNKIKEKYLRMNNETINSINSDSLRLRSIPEAVNNMALRTIK